MKLKPKHKLVEDFNEIEDPRIERSKRHKLIDLLTIASLAVICGADSWVAMESFGQAKLKWLKRILALPNGIPSHDTFARVFARLDPQQLQQSLLNWVSALVGSSNGQVIAIDGIKGNQGNLFEDVQQIFTQAQATGFAGIEPDFEQTVDKGHGGVEIRRCWTLGQVEFLVDADKWSKFTSIAMVHSERRIAGKIQRETRYYISSLTGNAHRLAQAVRSHWQVENSLHWVLDLAFQEDACRVRKDHAPENLALVRHIALNLLNQETTAKLGIKNKRLRVGWDEDYLLKVLLG